MICDRCAKTIVEGENRALHGQTLCEDCYIDALSPVKACDSWAVHCAKSFSKENGYQLEITKTQARILQVLKKTGGADLRLLLDELQIDASELEREIASLRHMEKLRAKNEGWEKNILSMIIQCKHVIINSNFE